MSRPTDDHDLFHDNGYVEDCQDCADEEATAEAEQLTERLTAMADQRLDALVALFMIDVMTPAERAAAERALEERS